MRGQPLLPTVPIYAGSRVRRVGEAGMDGVGSWMTKRRARPAAKDDRGGRDDAPGVQHHGSPRPSVSAVRGSPQQFPIEMQIDARIRA